MSSDIPSPRPPARRVLVVEDDRDCRESLRLLLQVCGHEVQTAVDGREGVERALEWRPDAAVVDINMPRLDGYGVAREVRAALGGDVLLIALTAYSQPEDREKALAAGFDAHLTKPADLRLLRALLTPDG